MGLTTSGVTEIEKESRFSIFYLSLFCSTTKRNLTVRLLVSELFFQTPGAFSFLPIPKVLDYYLYTLQIVFHFGGWRSKGVQVNRNVVLEWNSHCRMQKDPKLPITPNIKIDEMVNMVKSETFYLHFWILFHVIQT